MTPNELESAFGYPSPAALARALYKGTDCGAAMGVCINNTWVHGSDLPATWVEGISAIRVSSIVEGCDQCTETHEVDVSPGVETRFWAVADEVEQEAQSIWQDTHGCATCRAHWKDEGDDNDEDGTVPVWTECPDCGGEGEVI